MDIMMELDGNDLNSLRLRFLEEPNNSLVLTQFVDEMLQRLPPRSEAEQVSKLRDLFAQIDGDLEWSEFTMFCVEAGMIATQPTPLVNNHTYVQEEDKHNDKYLHTGIRHICWVPEKQYLMVCEKSDNHLKIFDVNFNLIHEIEVIDEGYGDAVNRCGLACSCYIKDLNYIGICSDSFSITLWDTEFYKFQCRFHNNIFQNVMCYSSIGCTLFTSGGPEIKVWDMHTRTTRDILVQHTERVMDLVEVPLHELICSCSLDHTISTWDIRSYVYRGSLKGHTLGVTKMVYVPSSDLLFSIGFEYDAFGWDLNTKRCLLKLVGHRFPLAQICNPPFIPERVITGDQKGNYRMWDARRTHNGVAPCLQMFTTSSVLSKFYPVGMIVNRPNRDLIMAGFNKLYYFRCTRTHVVESIPSECIYSETNFAFYTIAGSDISVWNARTGEQLSTYNTESEITGCCLDDRERKIIIGRSDGKIQVLNTTNGIVMKEKPTGTKDLIGCHYCAVDRMIVTVSMDGVLTVYDENDQDDLIIMRQMNNIHDMDVTCSAFSRELCLIATGSADFTLRLFDFQSLNILACLTGHTAEIVDVCIIAEYALVVSIDCDGYMLIWRYSNYKYKLLQVIPNFVHEDDTRSKQTSIVIDRENNNKENDDNDNNDNNNNKENESKDNNNNKSETRRETMVSRENTNSRIYIRDKTDSISVSSKDTESTFITSLPTQQSSFVQREAAKDSNKIETFPFAKVCAAFNAEKNQFLIITGDEKGYIRVWNISKLIESRRLRHLSDNDYPCNKASYTSRRRNFSTCKKSDALVYQTPYLYLDKEQIDEQQKEVEMVMRRFNPVQNLVTTFKAHNELITLLRYNEKNNTFISGSYDLSVKVWSCDGQCLGVLNRSMEEADAINRGDIKGEVWRFDVGYEAIVEKMDSQSKTMLNQIKRDKLKTRRSSILPAVHVDLPKVQSMTSSMDEHETQKLTKHNRILEQIVDKKITIEEKEDYIVDDSILMQKRRSSLISVQYEEPKPVYAASGDIYNNYNSEKARGRQLNISFKTKLDTTPSEFLTSQFKKRHIPLIYHDRFSKSMPELMISVGTTRSQLLRESAALQQKQSDEEFNIYNSSSSFNYNDSLDSTGGGGNNFNNTFGSSVSGIGNEITAMGSYTKSEMELIDKYYQKLEYVIASPPPPPRHKHYTKEEAEKELEETKELVNSCKALKPVRTASYSRIISKTKSHNRNFATHNKNKNIGVYSMKEVIELKKLFDNCDTDHSGYIDIEEFAAFPMMQGSKNAGLKDAMFETIDTDGSGCLGFDEVLRAALPYATQKDIRDMLEFVKTLETQQDPNDLLYKGYGNKKLTEKQKKEMEEMFRLCDRKKKGVISFQDLYNTFTSANNRGKKFMTEDDVRSILEKYFPNEDSVLKKSDFETLFKDLFLY